MALRRIEPVPRNPGFHREAQPLSAKLCVNIIVGLSATLWLLVFWCIMRFA